MMGYKKTSEIGALINNRNDLLDDIERERSFRYFFCPFCDYELNSNLADRAAL